MQDIDTEKLREILEMMKEAGAAYVKCGDFELAFPAPFSTDLRGFQADAPTETSVGDEAKNSVTVSGKVDSRPIGYHKLFGENFPKFPKASDYMNG